MVRSTLQPSRASIVARASWMLAFGTTLALASCSILTPSFRECPEPDADRLNDLPLLLSGTGLHAEVGSEEIAGDIHAFAPRFELWTDGATKRRWIHVPPGRRVDTSDPNAWRFPLGTKLWKEFERDGVRVETRLLLKHGAGTADWTAVAYVWEGDDARAMPGGVENAHGTGHDVPSASECFACHGGASSVVLGFSNVQLPASGRDGHLGLDDLAEHGLIGDPSLPRNDLPGDELTRAALGHLHANCAHCHSGPRPRRSSPRCFDPRRDFDFTLRIGELEHLGDTATYRTAIGSVALPGDPDGSKVVVWASSRDRWWGMPPLGTEKIDRGGVDLLRRWIRRLEPE